MCYKNLKKTAAVLLVLITVTLFSSTQLYAEYIFLKDGSVYNGYIISASPDEITIRINNSEIKKISREEVIKIVYMKQKKNNKNIKPDSPVLISIKQIPPDDRVITWKNADDPDGIVIKYRFYGTKGDIRTIIEEVTSNEFLLRNASDYDRVEITAVDNKETESDSVKIHIDIAPSDPEFSAGIYPVIFFPLGKSGEIYSNGYGGIISFDYDFFSPHGFRAGLSTGLFYSRGRDCFKDGKPDYHSAFIVPLFIDTVYQFRFGENFFISPSFSFGASYINLKYICKDINDPGKDKVSAKSFIDSTAKGGFGIGYSLTESLSISILAGYGVFIESNDTIPFAVTSIGVEFRF